MMSLSRAANSVNGSLHGPDALFTSVAIDSRQVNSGSLFVAIVGEQNDGHQFLSQAEEQGAVGAMVSVRANETVLQKSGTKPLSQIEVEDTTLALGQLAADWRSDFKLPVLGITGSNGKTTVTSMIATILGQVGNCLKPQKSFNNQWGVPLTLLSLNSTHKFAVIEMGTNHIGEIDYLTKIARPNIALINNVSAAHGEGLGDVDQIAKAKAEIFHGLEAGSVAVLNADDAFYEFWKDYFFENVENGEVISFALNAAADVKASNIRIKESGSQFSLSVFDRQLDVCLPLPGEHNVRNAVAAAAACSKCGISLDIIASGLERVAGVPGRLNIRQGLNKSTVIDDTYNANPGSVRAGIDVLSGFKGTRILVLGVMAELGRDAKSFHYGIGEYARKAGVQKMFCLGSETSSHAEDYICGFGNTAVIAKTVEELISLLMDEQDQNSVILVKGSRSSRMERIVDQIVHEEKSVSSEGAIQC